MGNSMTLSRTGAVRRKKTSLLTEVWNKTIYFNLSRKTYQLREFVFIRPQIWGIGGDRCFVSPEHRIRFIREKSDCTAYLVKFTNSANYDTTARFLHKGNGIVVWNDECAYNGELTRYFGVVREIFTSYVAARKRCNLKNGATIDM